MSSTAISAESISSVGFPALPPVDLHTAVLNQVAAPKNLEQMNLNTIVPGGDTEMAEVLLQ